MPNNERSGLAPLNLRRISINRWGNGIAGAQTDKQKRKNAKGKGKTETKKEKTLGIELALNIVFGLILL